jgi:hypothetical protein
MGLAFSRTGYPTLKIPHINIGIKVGSTETIIKFIGHLASDEVAQQLRSARIFITTSFAEGALTALLKTGLCILAVETSKSNAYV